MTKLVFESGQYIVPDAWRDPEWITDFGNFPDPMFYHLRDEYDWKRKNKSLTYSYITHLAGTEYARDLFNLSSDPSKKVRTYKGKTHSYFLFAVGAATLLNDPGLMRSAYADAMCGSDVINFINKIPLPDLFPDDWSDSPLFEKLYDRKNIIPMRYSALFSRTFNETSGVQNKHKLKIKPREPSLRRCPNCKAIFDISGLNVYTLQNVFAYNQALERFEKQKEERKEYESR